MADKVKDLHEDWMKHADQVLLFLYIPAVPGGYIEELLEHRPINDDEANKLRQRHHGEVVGPNPL
jgi:hypothetical protein